MITDRNLGFRLTLDFPTDDMLSFKDIMDERLNESDVEVCIRLPNGITESKYLSRQTLEHVLCIGLQVTDEGGLV